MTRADARDPELPQAVRLIFTYLGDQVQLADQQPVDTVIPGMDTPREQLPGRYVEVRDSQGRRLSQVAVRGAMAARAEVFPERPEDDIATVAIAQPEGAFTVVVPVTPAADHVAVVRREAVAPVRAEFADGLLGDATAADLAAALTAPAADSRTADGGLPNPGGLSAVELGSFPLTVDLDFAFPTDPTDQADQADPTGQADPIDPAGSAGPSEPNDQEEQQ